MKTNLQKLKSVVLSSNTYSEILITLLILLLISLGIVSVSNYLNNKKIIKSHKTTIQNKVHIIDSLVAKEKEIKVMQKTILLAYPQKNLRIKKTGKWILGGISEYEAKSYSYIFKEFADSFNVDWTIFPSVLWIETRFNPTLTSDKKAKGIGQLMDSTAHYLCNKIGIVYKNGTTLWTDIINVTLCCSYLVEGIKKDSTGKINYEHMIKRYYAGENHKNMNKSRKKIKKYYDDVYNQQQKLKDVFDEHEKLNYLYNGVKVNHIIK